ncbi:MAG: hypothetical protein R3E93_07340 [Thiothrix sp.]
MAASHSGLSIALILSSKNGSSKVFLGFKNDKDKENNPEIFESIVNGIFAGKKITLQETINISSCRWIPSRWKQTGVPILKK